MSPVDQAGPDSFLNKTQKTLDFSAWRLVISLTYIHFLAISCLRQFTVLYLAQSVSLSDLLAALYNLCFFSYSSVSSVKPRNTKRLNEVLMRILLSIVDSMLFLIHSIAGLLIFPSDFTCKSLKTTSHHLSSGQCQPFFLMKIFGLSNFFVFQFQVDIKGNHVMVIPGTTARVWIIISLLVKTRSKMFSTFLCRRLLAPSVEDHVSQVILTVPLQQRKAQV